MSKQRRFTKRFEIEAEINKLKRKAKQKLIDAQNYDVIADTAIKDSNVPGATAGDRQFLIEQADATRRKAVRARRSSEIITEEKVPALGRTLAAFQTNTLFPGDDQAVVLQK